MAPRISAKAATVLVCLVIWGAAVHVSEADPPQDDDPGRSAPGDVLPPGTPSSEVVIYLLAPPAPPGPGLR